MFLFVHFVPIIEEVRAWCVARFPWTISSGMLASIFWAIGLRGRPSRPNLEKRRKGNRFLGVAVLNAITRQGPYAGAAVAVDIMGLGPSYRAWMTMLAMRP